MKSWYFPHFESHVSVYLWIELCSDTTTTYQKGGYVPKDLKWTIKSLTLLCILDMAFDMLYFHYAMFDSLILLPLMVDQLIKSSKHLIEAKELPLSARLMIFIFVSIVVKFEARAY